MPLVAFCLFSVILLYDVLVKYFIITQPKKHKTLQILFHNLLRCLVISIRQT